MSKYKATINIDRDVWDKFRAKCDRENTTATAEITAFIKVFCLDREKEWADWDEMPKSVSSMKEDIVWEVLRLVEEKFDQGQYKLERRTNNKTDNKTDGETDSQAAIGGSTKTDKKTNNERGADTETDGETDQKSYFSDAEAAERERLHPATICRYRTGRRKMPIELATRWQVCPQNHYKWVLR